MARPPKPTPPATEEERGVVEAPKGGAPAGARDMSDEMLPEDEWFSDEERRQRDAQDGEDDFEIDWDD